MARCVAVCVLCLGVCWSFNASRAQFPFCSSICIELFVCTHAEALSTWSDCKINVFYYHSSTRCTYSLFVIEKRKLVTLPPSFLSHTRITIDLSIRPQLEVGFLLWWSAWSSQYLVAKRIETFALVVVCFLRHLLSPDFTISSFPTVL